MQTRKTQGFATSPAVSLSAGLSSAEGFSSSFFFSSTGIVSGSGFVGLSSTGVVSFFSVVSLALTGLLVGEVYLDGVLVVFCRLRPDALLSFLIESER